MKIFPLILVFSICLQSFASNQMPDVLLYNGETYNLFQVYPLELLYTKTDRPEFDDRHTALARGYVGYWQIIDDHIYLMGISGSISGKRVDISQLFAKTFKNGKVAGEWVTGVLIVNCGQCLSEYPPSDGIFSLYEGKRVFEIERGKIVRSYVLTKESNKEIAIGHNEVEIREKQK